MEFKKVKNRIVVTHNLKGNETFKLLQSSKFQSFTVMKKPQIVRGISNETDDNKGVLFIDYDGVDERIVLEDYKQIQTLFSLPPAYLFKTKENNFHIICLKKFSHAEIFNILSNTRADVNYKDMPIRNPFRSYVLRLSNKKGSKHPKFVSLVGEVKNLDSEISSAHLSIISKIYKLPKVDYQNKDGGKLIRFHTYETAG